VRQAINMPSYTDLIINRLVKDRLIAP